MAAIRRTFQPPSRTGRQEEGEVTFRPLTNLGAGPVQGFFCTNNCGTHDRDQGIGNEAGPVDSGNEEAMKVEGGFRHSSSMKLVFFFLQFPLFESESNAANGTNTLSGASLEGFRDTSGGEMATASHTAKARDPQAVRQEFRELVDRANENRRQADDIFIKLATRAYEVQVKRYWREYISQKTGKPFTGFDEWVREDSQWCRSKIYSLISVVKNLKLPAEELEEIGESKSVELAKVARDAPKQLPRVIQAVKDNPRMKLKEVKNLVSNALDGRHAELKKYRHYEFAVDEENASTVEKALLVMQEMDPLDDPDNRVSMGRHLVHLMIDWLGYPEPRAIAEKLEQEGVIDPMTITIEE